jgi:hypothetical protein
VTLNIFGLGWAFAVGIWLAAPAQPLAAAEGKVGSREGGSAVFSLRTLEIVAAVAGALLSVAAAAIMLLWLFLVYKGPYR